MKCKYCNAMNPDGMPVCLYCARPLVEIDQKEKKEEIQEEIKKDPLHHRLHGFVMDFRLYGFFYYRCIYCRCIYRNFHFLR